MNVDPSSTLRRDLARSVGTRRRLSAPAATKPIVSNPGVQAVLLLRAQMGIQAAGRHGLGPLGVAPSRRMTGAHPVVSCRAGPGLVLRHPQGVVIGRGAAIREDCTIPQRVTLGERYGDGADPKHEYPHLGARVVVGLGAAILGAVRVGDDAAVGANAVVVCGVDAADVVAGVPARSMRKAGGLGTPHVNEPAPP